MEHDVAIIGGGPGGYVAAIRMAQLDMHVALIEERDLGGVCLNRGCIPTKALYSAVKLIERAQGARSMGITFDPPEIDLTALAMWKDGVVARLVNGVAKLLNANKVSVIHAHGTIASPGRISLSTGETVEAKNAVIATGSSPIAIPGFSFEHPRIWSSDDALALTEIPDRLVVIGGGVIGLEIATIYNRLGSAVTILEMMPEILPGIDLDRRTIATLKRALKTQGITIRTDTVASSLEEAADGALVHTKGDEAIPADRVLLAVGRRPNSSGIGLEKIGVEPDRRGFIQVDENLRTSAESVYAIGDVIAGPMLAHRASNDALVLAEHLAGNTSHGGRDRVIPQAIFTDPEIASVGMSETSARQNGIDVMAGRFPFAALGKALGMNEPDGFFQVIAETKTHRLIGTQIIGTDASSLIAEAALAVQHGLTLEAIADSVHAHPTLPEGMKEAAEAALGRAIHAINR
ncbi:dihydrolipoyl dehydrogenase [Candidatus Bipolaricaulota bacterium]|nr:dihydrolipoyl dehydrogenase [Candidatus Bipolaricaulota bacterium]